jgi:hypothetical protein
MNDIAKKLLDAPFNWTGLTLKEPVDAGRIPEGNVNGYLTEIARDYLHGKYRGKDVEVNDYLNERDELFVALFSEFSYIKA